jgi:hypothetical protein
LHSTAFSLVNNKVKRNEEEGKSSSIIATALSRQKVPKVGWDVFVRVFASNNLNKV